MFSRKISTILKTDNVSVPSLTDILQNSRHKKLSYINNLKNVLTLMDIYKSLRTGRDLSPIWIVANTKETYA